MRAHPADPRRVELRVQGAQSIVPTLAWLPATRRRPPVVLLAHGGSGHKAGARQERLAHRLATEAGIASIAIDGPFHGDRRPAGDGPLDYQRRVSAEGARAVHDRMRDDWLAALAAAGQARLVDEHRVGFIGLSMGTRYGIAACAALGPRLRCAVFGAFGLVCAPGLAPLAADDVVCRAASQIEAPVMWQTQDDDEVFPRAGQLSLFDRLASPETVLRTRPGGHTASRPADEAAWREHVAAHL